MALIRLTVKIKVVLLAAIFVLWSWNSQVCSESLLVKLLVPLTWSGVCQILKHKKTVRT